MNPEEIRSQSADGVVPIIDEQLSGCVYSKGIHIGAAVGAVTGGLLLALVGYAVVNGIAPIPGLGQFGASGPVVAIFTAAGLGAAAGGLAGAMVGVFRLPRRRVAD